MDALHRRAFRRFAYHRHPRYRNAHARDVARCRHLRMRHGRALERTLAPVGLAALRPWGTWPVGLADRWQNARAASRRWLGGKRKGGSSDVALPPMCRSAEGIGAGTASLTGEE